MPPSDKIRNHLAANPILTKLIKLGWHDNICQLKVSSRVNVFIIISINKYSVKS